MKTIRIKENGVQSIGGDASSVTGVPGYATLRGRVVLLRYSRWGLAEVKRLIGEVGEASEKRVEVHKERRPCYLYGLWSRAEEGRLLRTASQSSYFVEVGRQAGR
jgi:hypothetical protein